jgi:hypothetical protein
MATQYIARRKSLQPNATAKANASPIYVDEDDNKLKMVPAASGTTEVEVIDASSAQSLSNKTFVAPSWTDSATVGHERIAIYDVVGATIRAAVTPAFVAPANCIITRAILNITTPSSGASTIDIGLTAVSATTSSDTLLDGVSGTPAAAFDSGDSSLDTAANDQAQTLASGKWVTIDEVSGDTTGLVGKLFIYYLLA